MEYYRNTGFPPEARASFAIEAAQFFYDVYPKFRWNQAKDYPKTAFREALAEIVHSLALRYLRQGQFELAVDQFAYVT